MHRRTRGAERSGSVSYVTFAEFACWDVNRTCEIWSLTAESCRFVVGFVVGFRDQHKQMRCKSFRAVVGSWDDTFSINHTRGVYLLPRTLSDLSQVLPFVIVVTAYLSARYSSPRANLVAKGGIFHLFTNITRISFKTARAESKLSSAPIFP
jgi:hypothetical protein